MPGAAEVYNQRVLDELDAVIGDEAVPQRIGVYRKCQRALKATRAEATAEPAWLVRREGRHRFFLFLQPRGDPLSGSMRGRRV
jgi:hypothetical protein